MARTEIQLTLDFEEGGGSRREPVRREPREDAVRMVEVAPFPRVEASQRPRIGFTRDLSPSGMCLGLDQTERVGSLLRVCVRDLEGRQGRESVGRVVWCTADADQRYWVGLELLSGTRPRRVPAGAAGRVASL